MYYDALYNLRDTCRELKDYRAAAEFERVLKDISSGRDILSSAGTSGTSSQKSGFDQKSSR